MVILCLFLNVLVEHKSSLFITSVYWKPTFTPSGILLSLSLIRLSWSLPYFIASWFILLGDSIKNWRTSIVFFSDNSYPINVIKCVVEHKIKHSQRTGSFQSQPVHRLFKINVIRCKKSNTGWAPACVISFFFSAARLRVILGT